MHDLIYCFRMLRKRPSFTVVAVLTLALAIGASTALFSIVNVVILNPFPYKDPSRLFFVRQSLPQIGVQDQLRASGPEFIDLAKSGIFERVAAFEPVSRNLTGSDEPERVGAAKVSTDFFTALDVEPLIGRTIAAKEQGPSGQRVLVISHGLWQRRFGGDHAVLGQKVLLDDEPGAGARSGVRVDATDDQPVVWCHSNRRNNIRFSLHQPHARRNNRMSHPGVARNESRSVSGVAI